MISPWVAGQTLPVWTVTWTNANLTGATLSVRFAISGVGAVGTGTFTVTNALTGAFTYAPSAADLATAGTVTVQFKAAYGGGAVLYSDAQTITVTAAV